MNPIYLVIGGSLGTLARSYAGLAITNQFGPRALATFAVNIVGSLAIGVFFGLGEGRSGWSNAVVLLVAVGFLGGFTTFSTLAWQTLELAEDGNSAGALLNIGASVTAGMIAVWVGASIARAAS